MAGRTDYAINGGSVVYSDTGFRTPAAGSASAAATLLLAQPRDLDGFNGIAAFTAKSPRP